MKTTDKVIINEEQRLFVIPSGKGFTCLGFDVCQKRTKAMLSWLIGVSYGLLNPPSHESGSPEAYDFYQELMAQCSKICLDRNIRCNIELTPQLIGLEGKRVEVLDKYGERRRFKVGKSMGWIPVHLELYNSRSVGGHAVTGAPFKSVSVIKN